MAWGVTYTTWPGWPPRNGPRSFRDPPPCCEQLLTCAGLRAADYATFSCVDNWKVRWPGFTELRDGTASCREMRAYAEG